MREQTNIETAVGCPFCGEPPTVKALQGCGHKHLVACKNATCPVAPSVIGATRADAIRRWNTRDAKTQDVLDEEYRIATSAEKEEAGVDEDYDLLIGPDGFECVLTEPEDRTFRRDLKPLVIELNRLLHLTSPVGFLDTITTELKDLRAENVKLKGTVSIKQDRINDLENALRDTLRQLEKAINGNAMDSGWIAAELHGRECLYSQA